MLEETRMGRWWLADDDRELASAALGAARTVDNETAERQYGIFERYALYGDDLGLPEYVPRRRVERMAHNVIAGIADTLVTEITQTVPRPMFYTAGGSYRQRKDAERLTSACDCKFEAEDMEQTGPDVLLDSILAGTGFFSVAAEGDEVKIQRLFPPDVMMDDSRLVDAMPRSLYVRRYPDKALLWELYEDTEQRMAIESAGTGGSLWAPFIRTRDVVETYECWHLPSKPGAGDGLRCLVIEGAVLEREEWEHDSYPIVPVRCLLPRIGFWGIPVISRSEPDQQELNKYALRTQQGAHRISVPRVLCKPGTITKSHINNTIGAIIECTEEPKFVTPQVFPPEHYQQMERHKRWAHEAAGVSELSVSSQIPAGMAGASGRSQLIYRHHQTRRLVNMDRAYGAAHCKVAREWVRLEGKLADEADGSRKVEYERRGRRDEVDWREIASDIEKMRIKLAPTSALAKEPAARMEGIQQLVQEQVITPQDGLRMSEDPDLKAIKEEQTADLERMHDLFEGMLEGGEYVPPDPFQPLDLGRKICLSLHSLGVLRGAEEDDLAKLRRWFEHSTSPNLGIKGEPEPAAAPPGGPPLPPEMMPPGAEPPMPGGPPPGPVMPPGPMPGPTGGLQ